MFFKRRFTCVYYIGIYHVTRVATLSVRILTWVTFSATEGLVHPGQVKQHSLPFQVEAVLKYLVVPLTFALDCTMSVKA